MSEELRPPSQDKEWLELDGLNRRERRRRRRRNTELDPWRRELLRKIEEQKRLDLLHEIVQLEHVTGVVPLSSEPDHCAHCADVAATLKRIRKVDV